jgi:chaperone modulatory protein CbpM
MKLSRAEFLASANVDESTLEVWIHEEWIIPISDSPENAFSDADLARVRLIRDLIEDLGVNEAGVGVVLNLVDQVHGLRSALAHVLQQRRDHV